MNKQELKQATKKLFSSPLMIVVAVLLVLSIVVDAVLMIVRKEFSLISLALNNIFTIFFVIFLFMLIFKKDDASQAGSLEGIRKTLKVKLILTIVGLGLAILGLLLAFIAFCIINQNMIDGMDIEDKYRNVLEAFLKARKVFILSALFLGGQLFVQIGFHGALNKSIKNAKYATFEEDHYHKGTYMSAAIWGCLFVAFFVASAWLELWMLQGLIAPLSALEGVVEGFKMPEVSVDFVLHIRDFVYAAAVVVVLFVLVMQYINCDKLKESHAEAKEEAKDEPKELEDVKEEKEEEPKEEPKEEEPKEEPEEEPKEESKEE